MPDSRDTIPPAKPAAPRRAPARPEVARYSHPGREPSDPANPRPIPRVNVAPMQERATSDAGLGEAQRAREDALLRAMAQMQASLQAQIAEAKEAAEQAKQQSMRPPPEATKGDKGEPGKAATWVQSLPAIIIAVTGLVAALGALARKDSDDSDKVYAELKQAVEANAKAQNEALQKNTAADEARWNWMAGFVKSLPGVKVVDAPGATPIAPLDLEPAPVMNSKGRTLSGAPAVQVSKPLPKTPPVPSAKPVVLPPPEALFGKKP